MNEEIGRIRMDEMKAWRATPEARDSYERASAALKEGPDAVVEYLRDDPHRDGWAKAMGAQHEGRELPDLALFSKEEFWGWMDGVEQWPDGKRKGYEFIRIADECQRRADALTDTVIFLERRHEVYRRMGQ